MNLIVQAIPKRQHQLAGQGSTRHAAHKLDRSDSQNGNYIEAEMVKAFLDSVEYRARFGP
jgi:hypothetical protein